MLTEKQEQIANSFQMEVTFLAVTGMCEKPRLDLHARLARKIGHKQWPFACKKNADSSTGLLANS